MVKASNPSTKFEAKTRSNEKGLGRAVFQAAQRSAEFFDHLRAHYREARRTPVRIECDVIFRRNKGEEIDSGAGVILNLSPSGALLGELKLTNNCYPMGSFVVEIVMKGEEYEGIGLEAKPVRFDNETGGIGVKFEEIFVKV